MPKTNLPTDSAMRKEMPVTTGFIDYFPDAAAVTARLSVLGNEKHNPGEALHWAKGKSTDEPDCIARHLTERGTIDEDDGVLHDVKMFWRAGANLQRFIDEHGIEACFDEAIIAKVRKARADKAQAALATKTTAGPTDSNGVPVVA